MNTKTIKIGDVDVLLSEITIQEEIEAKNLYRSSWRGTHQIMNAVDEEGERLACCAYMIKKVGGKELTPLQSFDYILSLPRKHGERLRFEFTQLNDSSNFFDFVAQMVQGISGKGTSSKNTEGLITSKQENSPEEN